MNKLNKNKKKMFVLNGEKIKSLDSFYDEVQEVLFGGGKGFGRNLDALVDLLRGGFGVFDYNERIVIIWKNYHLSSRFEKKKEVIEIFEKQENIEFRVENF
jgi:RNAse (barnase) inhibitor barstar